MSKDLWSFGSAEELKKQVPQSVLALVKGDIGGPQLLLLG